MFEERSQMGACQNPSCTHSSHPSTARPAFDAGVFSPRAPILKTLITERWGLPPIVKRAHRLLGIAVLILAVGGVNVAYASADFQSGPDSADIIADPAAHDGEGVFLFAEVAAVDEAADELTIELEAERITAVGLSGARTEQTALHEITVRTAESDISGTVEAGSNIQLYGSLQAESTVFVAERIVVDFQNASDWRYMYLTSIAGTLIAAGYFFKHWRVNLRELRFEPRGES